MISLLLVGAGLAVVAGLIALLVTQTARAARFEAEKEIADAEAEAKARADRVLAEHPSRDDIVKRLHDRDF